MTSLFAGVPVMQGMGDSGLPPGCRAADLDRAASCLDDLSAAELWALLDSRQQDVLYRRFFRERWDELAAYLEDEPPGRLGEAIFQLWVSWRSGAVQRLAMLGEIHTDQKG